MAGQLQAGTRLCCAHNAQCAGLLRPSVLVRQPPPPRFVLQDLFVSRRRAAHTQGHLCRPFSLYSSASSSANPYLNGSAGVEESDEPEFSQPIAAVAAPHVRSEQQPETSGPCTLVKSAERWNISMERGTAGRQNRVAIGQSDGGSTAGSKSGMERRSFQGYGRDITGGARMNTSATVYTPENQPIFPVRFDRPISHVCASPPSNTYRTHPELSCAS